MSDKPLWAEDIKDLPFDVSNHAEALKSFAAMNLASHCIRPALRARDLIFMGFPSGRFRVGVTENPAAQEITESGNGGIAFELICEAHSAAEAQQVRNEVERYFLRHYPGRTLKRDQEAGKETSAGNCVYIACYPPGDEA